MPAHRYMEEISSATMLADKRSAGVTPEVNLYNMQYIRLYQAGIRLPTVALKPREDITRSQKQEYQWHHKKDLYPSKKLNP